MIVPMIEAIARMMMMKIASFMDVKNFHTWSIKESTRFPSAMGIRPRTIYKFQIFIIHASAGRDFRKITNRRERTCLPLRHVTRKTPRYFLWHPLHMVGAFLLASFLWQSLHIS